MHWITNGNRVRDYTAPETNTKIDKRTLENIKSYTRKSEQEISYRIKQLDKEWDIERYLGLNLSTLALSGIVLSQLKDRKWLSLSTVALFFFAQHALRGWCPPIKLLRAMNKRTRNEIDQEKHALKGMRGDYKGLKSAEEAFIAAKKIHP